MQRGKKDLHGYKILVILASVFLILLFDHFGFLEEMDRHLYDLSFRLRGPHPPSKEILLIVIHEGTLKKLGRWPIRRLHYSSLLERLKQAKVVVFDITLSEPTGDDFLLAESIKRHGRVILPVHIDNQMNVVSPAPTLGAFFRTGHVHLEEGVDGIVRDVYHTLLHQRVVIPSISSVAYERFLQTSFRRMSPPPSDHSDKDIIQMDRMRINYCGPPGTFETISFSDVLDGVYPPVFFEGKTVLVGVGAIGLGDQFLTPFSQNRNYMPGIEVQANILNSLLMNNSIQVLPPWIHWLFVLLLSLLSYLLFLKVPERKAALLGLAFLIGMTTTLYILFSTWNLWLRPVAFYVTILAVFLVAYVMKLEDAAKNLDRAYAEMLPQLRGKENAGEGEETGRGVSGILTPGGIQSKIRILANVSHQLALEKENADKLNRELLSEIKERDMLENKLRNSERRVRHLSFELLMAQEKERRAIAAELHDSFASDLAAIKWRLERQLLEKEKGQHATQEELLEDVIMRIQNAIVNVRGIMSNLRPSILDDFGILATICWFTREFEKTYGHIRVESRVGIKEEEVPDVLKIVIFRILQEATSNMAKHSGGDRIVIALERSHDKIQLSVRDNGHGFDISEIFSVKDARKGLGLTTMWERVEISGGKFIVESTPEKGTVVQAEWPAITSA